MKLLLLVLLIFSAVAVEAAPVQRLFQDVKLPTQKVIEHQSWASPAAGNTTLILSGAAGNTSAAAASTSTFLAQPDFARNLVMTSLAGSGGVTSCVVVISGTNYAGSAISENFTFSSGTQAVTGNKAFKTVTLVSWPASCENSTFATTWALGTGVKFGLKRCMANVGDSIKDLTDGALATIGTYVVDASHMESNTNTLNTTPNASHSYDAYFMQNYGCFK